MLALFFYRLADGPVSACKLLPPPVAAHLLGELSRRESSDMAASVRHGFSFDQSREQFRGSDWRNTCITNSFHAQRQRKHISPALAAGPLAD